MNFVRCISVEKKHFQRIKKIGYRLEISLLIITSALRLLALRGLQTLRIRRVALRAPGVSQSNIHWDFLLYINIVNKS